jgi:tRNA(His) 5'-end guanylyltransferase
MADDFGDRMKAYERRESLSLMPRVPAMARLDGRAFHAFTKHCKRPFSLLLHRMMVAVTTHLVVHSCADVGYTQSDEITLCWLGQPFFDGHVQKMVSSLAAMASVHLQTFAWAPEGGPTMGDVVLKRETVSGLAWNKSPTFDCRVWSVPDRVEAANVFLWRQMDASRNSVQMAARHYLGHAACDKLNGKELQEELYRVHGINWSDYDPWCKRGTFVRHGKTLRAFTSEEIAALPERHHARNDPSLVVERRVLVEGDIDLRSYDDRVTVLFEDDPANHVRR